jgi:hypothetical protein
MKKKPSLHKKEHHGHHKKEHEKKAPKKHHSSAKHKMHDGKHHASHSEHHEKGHDGSKKSHPKMWIAGAIKHPGALRKELHVKKGHKIPAKKLMKAAKHGGIEGRRARLAMTLKRLGHRKHKKGE